MKIIYLKLLLALFLISSYSSANEYAVISNKKISDISSTQIKAIFLKKTSYIDDIKVIPVNLGAKNSIRSSFEKRILKMHLSRLKSYWTKQHYLGRRPPLSMKSPEMIKAFVKKVDGALGYIDSKNIDNSVNVLYKWSE